MNPIPYKSPWSEVTSCAPQFLDGSRQNFGGNWRKPPKSCFQLLPLSLPRVFNLETWYRYHLNTPRIFRPITLKIWWKLANTAKNMLFCRYILQGVTIWGFVPIRVKSLWSGFWASGLCRRVAPNVCRILAKISANLGG